MNYFQYLENIWITYSEMSWANKMSIALFWVNVYQLDLEILTISNGLL